MRGVLSRAPCQPGRQRCPSEFFELDASRASSRAWLLSALAFRSSPAGRRRRHAVATTATAVPQIQFIDEKCLSLRTDRLFMRLRSCTFDKIVCVPVIMHGGFWMNFFMFYVLALFTWKSWTLFLRAVSNSHSVFMLQNMEAFGRISCCFLREDGLESQRRFSGCSAQFALGIWTIFLEQLVRRGFWQESRTCVTFAFFALVPSFPGRCPFCGPRALTPVSARGLPGCRSRRAFYSQVTQHTCAQFMLWCCRHRHPVQLMPASETTTGLPQVGQHLWANRDWRVSNWLETAQEHALKPCTA